MKLATAAQMREMDRRAIEEREIPSLALMERAARGVADAVRTLAGRGAAVALLCGSGNNGGDGIAAARLLYLSGYRVRVFLTGAYEKLTPDAMEMTRRLSECGVPLEWFQPEDEDQQRFIRRCGVLVDAVFGVGLNRPVEPDSLAGAAIRAMNESPAPVVAADIASGVCTDSGLILGSAVRAALTVTFTLRKIGQTVGEGAACSGAVTVWDIGIPADLVQGIIAGVQSVERDFAAEALPRRCAGGHKGTFGRVLAVGGSRTYPGAPWLMAEAAQRSGCGLVTLAVPESIWAVEAARCTSVMPLALPEREGRLCPGALAQIQPYLESCDVLALGPGLGRGEDVQAFAAALLETEKPVVLDADGINALSGHIDVLDARRDRVTVLTPHDGEFARLGGDLSAGRVEAARSFAAAHGCILVLKGHPTVIAVPQGNVLVNTTGGSGLAKGGSGDVLTGLIASLLAQGATPVRAAALGVWLHGRAGDLAEAEKTAYATLPTDVLKYLPGVFGELLNS